MDSERDVLSSKILFHVSNMGKIKSTTGIITRGYMHHGYRYYGEKNVAVHQAVLFKFFGPAPSQKHSPNHVDNDTKNNRIENLVWATQKEQVAHSYATNAHRRPNAPSQSKIVEISSDGGESWFRYESVTTAAAQLGLSMRAISMVCRGLQRMTKNFQCRFVNKQSPLLENEEWRKIILKGKETKTFVSNLGRIKTKRNVISYGSKRVEKYMVSKIDGKSYGVHVLVALAFLGEPENAKLTVDHINHIRSDNRLVNLRYATAKEQSKNQGPRSRKSSPIEARKIGESNYKLFSSAIEVAKIYNISAGEVRKCCRGVKKSIKNNEFRFANEPDLPGEKWLEFTDKDFAILRKQSKFQYQTIEDNKQDEKQEEDEDEEKNEEEEEEEPAPKRYKKS